MHVSITQYVLVPAGPAERIVASNPILTSTGIIRDNVARLVWQNSAATGMYKRQQALDYVD